MIDEALGMYATIVTVTGDITDMVIYNPQYDMRELTIRLGAYNAWCKENPQLGKQPISVDEMTASIENGDMSLVYEYEEWYDYVGKNECIPEYKIELQKTLNNISSNNEDTIDTITDEQVKELISKHENQMYEIKKELWECE